MKLSKPISFAAGALFVLAFAPFNYSAALPIALGTFYLIIRNRYDFKHAFLFALGMNTFGVSWVYNSIHTYGNQETVIAFFLTVGFIIFLSAYFAACFYVAGRPFFRCLRTKAPCLFFAMAWVTFEWVKTTPVLCFPWLQVAYALSASPMRSLLPVAGILGSGLIATWLIAKTADGFNQGKFQQSFLLMTLILGTSLLLSNLNWTAAQKHSVKVTAIQANLTEFEKWNPDNLQSILQTYIDKSLENMDSNIIVWPEGALPMAWQDGKAILTPLFDWVRQNHIDLILGTPYRIQANRYYNSLMSISQHDTTYHKQNLVYFGENLPFDSLLRPLLQLMQVPEPIYLNPPSQTKPVSLRHGKFAPSLCYDIAFNRTLSLFFPDATFMLTISDDAWFGHSIATAQHVQISRAQSQVYSRPQIIVNNNGLSTLIDHRGRTIEQLPEGVAGTLTNVFTPHTGSTPATHINEDYMIIVLWLLFILRLIPFSSLISLPVPISNKFGLLKR